MKRINGKRIARIMGILTLTSALLFFFVIVLIALFQMDEFVMPYSALYIISIPLILFAMFGIYAIAFNYCPKRLLPEQAAYTLVLYIVVGVAFIYMLVIFAYCVYQNYSTLQALLTDNIIDPDNLLPAYIADTKKSIALCWVSIALSILGLASATYLFASRIKNRIDKPIG